MDKGKTFRALHEARSAFVIPNPWDIGTAKLLASLGFKALATTSAGFAFSRGLPDGAVGFEAMIHHCRELAAATDLPVSADLEKGKGDSPESAGETIFAAEAAGLAGCSIEDHSGDPENPIYDFNLAVERVAAAVDAARSLKRDFVFTARAENYLWNRPDLDDTIRRLQAFDKAGADVLYAPGIADIATVEKICKAVSKPVNVLVVPGFTVADLANAGAKRISLGSKLATFVYGMLQTSAREMLQDGTFGFTRAGMPFAKVQELFKTRHVSGDKVSVIDMHTGGEPVRIVAGGYPAIPGGTILEKRAWVRANLDHLRKMLIFEPRGHYDMYGALLVEPDLAGADLAVLFMHNEGYSTMCGHAVIALGRYAVDHGLVAPLEPVTTVNIECPCGLVVASVEVSNGRAGAVSFESVPAFLLAGDQSTRLERYGEIRFDMAYGGAFYALADCRQFGLAFGRDRVRDFVDAATALTEKLKAEFPLSHPDHDDLAFLYGSILTDGGDDFSDRPTKNVCVFAEAEVDRSPTGSGVTARLAAMHAKGQIAPGQSRVFESIVGSRFTGAVARTTQAGAHAAIIARIGGRAFYSGRAEFSLEDGDELGTGFLVR